MTETQYNRERRDAMRERERIWMRISSGTQQTIKWLDNLIAVEDNG